MLLSILLSLLEIFLKILEIFHKNKATLRCEIECIGKNTLGMDIVCVFSV